MTIVDWPLSVLSPRHVAIWPAYRNRPEQRATNGMRRSPGRTSASFMLRLIDVPVFDKDRYRAMTAMLGLMEGDGNLVRIRLPDLYATDGPAAEASEAMRLSYPQGVPFDGGVFFSSGTGFELSTLSATLTTDAALNAREIFVDAGEEVAGGTIVSIEGFCHIVTGSWVEEEGNRLKLSPVLRKAAASGTSVDLAPVFVGVCTTQSAGSEERQYGRYGFYTFEFEEDLTRLVEDIS